MAVEVRVLGPGDAETLLAAADGVFDGPVDPRLAARFLGDPSHAIAVALDGGRVVGFASGVAYVHPDKPLEMFVDELGVAPTHRRRGIATRVLRALLDRARALGCREAWVLTDRENAAAMATYAGLGGERRPHTQEMFTFRLEG